MKNIIKTIGLCSLIGFSFFYTDKVVEVIREEDEIMIELTSVEDVYQVLPVDAKILGNTIIPGLAGRNINIEESYKKMKPSGIFNKNLIIYDTVLPKVSIHNNKNKFIIKGNPANQMVSIVFILKDNKYLYKIEETLKSKTTAVNYFVDYTYLINNSTKIKEIGGNEFYSYGDNGVYTLDNLLFSNNLISRIRTNKAIYCLTSSMAEDVINLCSKKDLHTIVPTIIGDKTPYANIKNNLSSGSIIMLSMNTETINELPIIIDYIKGKGLKIVGLSTLLSEDIIITN